MDSGVHSAGLDGGDLEMDYDAGGFRLVLDCPFHPSDDPETDPMDRDYLAGGSCNRSPDHKCDSEKSGCPHPAL